ncbi:MAG: hypothetical protein K0S61_1893 [Anaerocolumna sp.]|jgi:beta-glucosidase|nr:hypothetical protein [Anaerocolumna sp.]
MKKSEKIGIIVIGILIFAIIILTVRFTTTKKEDIPVTPPTVVIKEEMDNIKSKAKIIKEGGVEVLLTSTEQAQNQSWYKKPYNISNTLTQSENLNITEKDDTKVTEIHIDTSKTYDPFYGIGTSLEESTVNNLMQLKEEERKNFIYKLVDPIDGAGMTLFRLTIGTSDFTGQEFYTYYDGRNLNGEPNWYKSEGEEGFTIQKDIDTGIIEIAQMVMEAAKYYNVEDEIRFFSSPWTPPGWMKLETPVSQSFTNNDLLLKGGRLNSEYIDDLAMYYTRYVEEYIKLGIPISALTLQNEPLLEIDYPSCHITAVQSAQLAIALKNALNSSDIIKEYKAKIPKLWTFDHNPSDLMSFMGDFFSVEGALEAVDGVAVHDYSGALSEMEFLKEFYFEGTDKTVHLTERSVWGTKGANRIIDYFRNGAISYNSWVTMLDSNISPHQWVGTPSTTMFVREAGSDSNYWSCPEFYIAGNFGRFIRPGYVRVESEAGSTDTITNVVYANKEDGTIAAVLVNQTSSTQNFKLVFNEKQILGTIPAGNVATYTWKENAELIGDPVINGGSEAAIDVDTSGRTVDTSKQIPIDDKAIILNESEAFENIGSFETNITKGNYLDYLIDVKEQGIYQITYSVKCDSDGAGVAFGLTTQWGLKDNPAQIGDNKENISIPSLYGAQKIRYAVTLDKGAQTLRFKALRGGYNISNITIQKAMSTAITGEDSKINAIDFYDSQNAHAIENDRNIGYTSAGSTLDYLISVEQGGTYNLALNYSSAAVQPSIGIQAVKADNTVSDLSVIALPSTGDWNTYNISEKVLIDLEEGEYTLRLVVLGDGINLSEIILSK